MADKKYTILKEFLGVDRSKSKRDSINHLQTLTNMDSNLEDGALISRLGSVVKQSSGSTPSIDKFVMFRDEEYAKDILLVYEQDATPANRSIYVYTRTAGTDNSFAPHATANYDYGSIRFGTQLSFLVHRNSVRIGTGTDADNRAMFMGYIDRRTDSTHDAMFGDTIEFTDIFLLKQQWVQQESLMNKPMKIIYDSTREKYYVLTTKGLEIKDSDFYTEKILNDVTSWKKAGISVFLGGLALSGNNLYAIGKIPGSDDTKVIQYNLANDFTISNSVTYASGSNNYGHHVTTNGTKVYVTATNSTNGYIYEYTTSLGGAVILYTGVGAPNLFGITYDATYVYFIDYTNSLIRRVPIAGGAAVNHSTGIVPLDIAHYSGNLYFCSATVVYSTAVAGFPNADAKTAKFTDANQSNLSISFLSAIPYLSQLSGRFVYFDNVTDWNVNGYVPTKLSMGWVSATTTTYANMATFFYAFSIVDIYGQESHLHRACAITATKAAVDITAKISVNVHSENFAEMTSPSTDPAEELSVWNEFRRMKKIRVYRAYSDTADAAEPTTTYRFLKDIDINDFSWIQVTANALYTFVLKDELEEERLTTVEYEDSSGLPEAFKPYYTNWQYGIQFESRYYYGNVRTDELNYHQMIETPINAPDVAYQHSENIDYFYTTDGDSIQGFAQVWNRLIVFKGNNCAVYRGLTRENTYDIGTTAPDSIIVHNNVVFFVYGTGIYALAPSGYKRISEPVDDLLQAETSTNLDLICSAHFKEKMKLWFMIPGRDSFMYNLNKGTWDIYDISPGNRDVAFIAQGLDDTIYTTDSYDGKIYKENVGFTDGVDATPIAIGFRTNDIAMGGGYLDAFITRLFLTAKYAGTTGIVIYYKNRNGTGNTTKTFAASTGLSSLQLYVNSIWGQYFSFGMTKSITAEVKIDSIGFEYFLTGVLQDAS
jgi:hypothetical protein